MKRLSAAAVCLLLGACIYGQPARDPASLAGPLPYAAIRAAPAPGENAIMLLAGISFTFRIDDDCVLIEAMNGDMVLPHFFDGASVGRDARGPYIRDGESGAIFYDGDHFSGGGGAYDLDVLELRGNTRAPVPETCLARVGDRVMSLNPGFRHH